MTKREMLEFLCVRESASLCDKLIQSLMKWEDVTNEKVQDDIMLPLDHLLRTLRSGEAELLDKMEFESEAQQ
ncbi:MAG: hypothetical protein IJU23_11020 [Proteobacteria bacterium]|nr:hypothetical protein [Pseudomonadota bacterium]